MNEILRKGTYLIFLILLISCGTNKVVNNTKVNTYPNSKYKKSSNAYSGTLNKVEYNELIKQLEIELKTTFPSDKSILINYNQKAPNCINVRFSEKDNKQVANNRIRISSRMSSNYNAIDFFVYAKDSYNKEVNEIKDILNDKRYNELLRLGNLNDGRVKICYVGDDEVIDELIVFGRSNKYGFAVIRVLGDDMEVSKIMELGPIISQLNTEDINVEGFMDFML